MATQIYDIAIIGGGINGCGIAADASMRGLSVFLCEKDDFASHTSAQSTKLIHGGLRYLEQFDFALVRKSLKERETLLHIAPHLIKPLQIIIPQSHYSRPAWLVRLGLFLYDKLGGKSSLPKSQRLNKKRDKLLFQPLQSRCSYGFSYYDGYTHDTRLTLCNALQAKFHGATLNNYTTCIKADYQNELWQLTLHPRIGPAYTIQAKTLINATGPWESMNNVLLNLPSPHTLSLVKGSHILVPKLFKGEQGYLLQHQDKRVIFVLPYQGYTMIGTTDVAYHGSPDAVSIDEKEIEYLIQIYNDYLDTPIQRKDVVYSWSGVRPLIFDQNADPRLMSRDYLLELSDSPGPCLHVFGGKLTTYRELAQHAIDLLKPKFSNLSPCLTQRTPLPGAPLDENCSMVKSQYKQKYSWLPQPLFERLWDTYGTRISLLLSSSQCLKDLGEDLGQGLTEQEILFLITHEWAKTTEDILYRRTQLGLSIDSKLHENLKHYLEKNYHECLNPICEPSS